MRWTNFSRVSFASQNQLTTAPCLAPCFSKKLSCLFICPLLVINLRWQAFATENKNGFLHLFHFNLSSLISSRERKDVEGLGGLLNNKNTNSDRQQIRRRKVKIVWRREKDKDKTKGISKWDQSILWHFFIIKFISLAFLFSHSSLFPKIRLCYAAPFAILTWTLSLSKVPLWPSTRTAIQTRSIKTNEMF